MRAPVRRAEDDGVEFDVEEEEAVGEDGYVVELDVGQVKRGLHGQTKLQGLNVVKGEGGQAPRLGGLFRPSLLSDFRRGGAGSSTGPGRASGPPTGRA